MNSEGGRQIRYTNTEIWDQKRIVIDDLMLQSRNRGTAVDNTCICRGFFQEFKKKGCGGEEMWGGLTPASTRSALPLQARTARAPGAGAEAKVDAGGKVCVEVRLGQRAA